MSPASRACWGELGWLFPGVESCSCGVGHAGHVLECLAPCVGRVLAPTPTRLPLPRSMWSIWMFTVPSLRAKECMPKEKDALNQLFVLVRVGAVDGCRGVRAKAHQTAARLAGSGVLAPRRPPRFPS